MKTYVSIILDKSGSMQSTKDSTLTGFNEQIQQLKEDSKEQEIYCSIVTFNGNVYENTWNVDPKTLEAASNEDYVPNGGTAMLDAIGYTVKKMIDTTDFENKDNSYLVIIISDGETNSDKIFNTKSIKQLIDKCQETKRWTFNYIGCSEDYLKQIEENIGINASNMAAWKNSSGIEARNAFKNIVSRQAKYFSERKMGATCSLNFASDDDSSKDFSSEIYKVEQVCEEKLVKATGDEQVDFKSLLSNLPQYKNQTVECCGKSLKNKVKVEY